MVPSVSRSQADNIMSSSGWLLLMPETFRTELLKRAILMDFAPGKAVFRFGDPVGGIYGLVSGSVTVNSSAPDAAPRLIYIGVPGSWTGEGCFMTGQPRRGELRALTDARMMHVPLPAMEEMAVRDPRAIRAFGVISILGVDVLVRVIHDLQQRDVDRRIASVLQRLAWTADMSIPLSQTEVGTMANASRKQVNAALQRFVNAGWLEKQSTYRSIMVADADGLRRFAEGDGSD